MSKSNSRLNKVYDSMKRRCCNPNDHAYKSYGGRGITVCDEQLDKTIVPNTYGSSKGWIAFRDWALDNGYAEGLTIDRIDNNKGYSPDNCRWVSVKEQNNNKRSNHLITYKGKTQTLAQWCDELRLVYHRTKIRINQYHWSVEKAFENKDYTRHRNITYKGKTQHLAEWCRELGVSYRVVQGRMNKLHWSFEKAIDGSPVGKEC